MTSGKFAIPKDIQPEVDKWSEKRREEGYAEIELLYLHDSRVMLAVDGHSDAVVGFGEWSSACEEEIAIPGSTLLTILDSFGLEIPYSVNMGEYDHEKKRWRTQSLEGVEIPLLKRKYYDCIGSLQVWKQDRILKIFGKDEGVGLNLIIVSVGEIGSDPPQMGVWDVKLTYRGAYTAWWSLQSFGNLWEWPLPKK